MVYFGLVYFKMKIRFNSKGRILRTGGVKKALGTGFFLGTGHAYILGITPT